MESGIEVNAADLSAFPQKWTIPLLTSKYMAINNLLVATKVSNGVYTMQASSASKTCFSPGDGAVFMTVCCTVLRVDLVV
jgi:hypothetical protein